MPPSKKRKKKNPYKSQHPLPSPPVPEKLPLLSDDKKNKYFIIAACVLFFAFALYKAITLFGALPVPSPDYPGYVSMGKTLLDFKLPENFKRAPVVGVLQVATSYLLGEKISVLWASWLLNAILSVANVFLVWILARQFIGKSAVWLTVIAMVNPWILYFQAEPVAETSMIFFILICYYFIFRRSNWVYPFASVAALVRYECSALIFIAFVADMFLRNNTKEKIRTLLWAVLASIPFLLWMYGTYTHWETSATSHYLKHFDRKAIGIKYFEDLWITAYQVMFQLPAVVKSLFQRPSGREYETIKAFSETVNIIGKVLVSLTLLAGISRAVMKRNWKLGALLLFVVLYVSLHASRDATNYRYCLPIAWMMLTISWYGLQGVWGYLIQSGRVPGYILKFIEIIVSVLVGIWLVRLMNFLPQLGRNCPSAAYLPHVCLVLFGLFVLGRALLFRFQYLIHDLMIAVLMSLMVVSMHATTMWIVRDGMQYREYTLLMDWYRKNAQPGEKLATRHVGTIRYIAPENVKNLVKTQSLRSKNEDKEWEGFIRNCYEKKLTYVTWSPRGSKGTKKGLMMVAKKLIHQKDAGPFQFICRIQPKKNNPHWVNIFRLRYPPPDWVKPKTETQKMETSK